MCDYLAGPAERGATGSPGLSCLFSASLMFRYPSEQRPNGRLPNSMTPASSSNLPAVTATCCTPHTSWSVLVPGYARGGLLGRPVELFIEDSATEDSAAESAAARLVEEGDVDVVLGGIYSSTRQAIKGPAVDQGRKRSRWSRTWGRSIRRRAKSGCDLRGADVPGPDVREHLHGGVSVVGASRSAGCRRVRV